MRAHGPIRLSPFSDRRTRLPATMRCIIRTFSPTAAAIRASIRRDTDRCSNRPRHPDHRLLIRRTDAVERARCSVPRSERRIRRHRWAPRRHVADRPDGCLLSGRKVERFDRFGGSGSVSWFAYDDLEEMGDGAAASEPFFSRHRAVFVITTETDRIWVARRGSCQRETLAMVRLHHGLNWLAENANG